MENKALKIKSPEAIIFDKDGTLLSLYSFWGPVSYEAIRCILNKNSAPISLADRIMKAGGFDNGKADIRGVLSYGTFEEIAELIAEELKKEEIEFSLSELIIDTKREFEDKLSLGVTAPTCEGLFETLSSLKSRSVKLFVVTTDRINSTMLGLRTLGIDSLFDEVITAEKVTPKPDPAAIEYLVSKYGFDKKKMVMVGDTFNDTRFAKAGGIFGVAVSDIEENRHLLSEAADAVIEKISDIFDVVEF